MLLVRALQHAATRALTRSICTDSAINMSSNKYKFMKPVPLGKSTRFLFCGNCGPGIGHDEPTIHDVFKPFGAEEIVVPNPSSAFVFAVFHDEAGAAKAFAALKDEPCPGLGNRKLVLRFSDAVLVRPCNLCMACGRSPCDHAADLHSPCMLMQGPSPTKRPNGSPHAPTLAARCPTTPAQRVQLVLWRVQLRS